MGTEDIIRLANEIKKRHNGKSILDMIKDSSIELGFTNLKPNLYPAYTINFGKNACIVLNNHFNVKQQNILAAHELGHALLHTDNFYNQFGDERDAQQEYEANLFAVSLLFNEEDINVEFERMSNYELKFLLDYNIKNLSFI